MKRTGVRTWELFLVLFKGGSRGFDLISRKKPFHSLLVLLVGGDGGPAGGVIRRRRRCFSADWRVV